MKLMSELIIPEMTETEAEEFDRLCRYAIDKDQAKRFAFEHRQAQIAHVAEKLGKPDRYGALGEPLLEIDADTFFKWDILHNGCWNDAQFIHEFWRDNDACRMKQPNRRIFNGF